MTRIMITYGSVCSGIEAASVAWEDLGFKPEWFSEIEPFPSEVLSTRWPDVANLGDMTQIWKGIRSGEIVAPDILVGGTPCQAFSVAGLRESLSDDRGQLTLSFVNLADEIDAKRSEYGKSGAIIVWENVPGVLSTRDNAFGCFLAGVAGESEPLQPAGKKWTNAGCVYGPKRTVAWRVLDAQYFSLAQRRRRVFVIASARDGVDPTEILFERESLRRDSKPSREAGEKVASFTGCGFKSASGQHSIIPFEQQGRRIQGIDGVYPTIMSNSSGGMKLEPIYYPIQNATRGKSQNGLGVAGNTDPMYTLDTVSQHGVASVLFHSTGAGYWQEGAGTLRARSQDSHENLVLSVSENQRSEVLLSDVVGTLQAGGGKPGQGYPAVLGVCSFKIGAGSSAGSIGLSLEQAPTLTSANSGTQLAPGIHCITVRPDSINEDRDSLQAACIKNVLRRLMPVECERLQGFPDDYTKIRWRNKSVEDCPDGHRYRAIGNSMATPVMKWIGNRISTLMSLNSPEKVIH